MRLDIPPGSMVDTNILVFAVRNAPKKATKEVEQRHGACRWTVGQMRPLRVGAVSWTEFLRYGPKPERAAIEALAVGSVEVEAVDRRVSELAAELLHTYRTSEKACTRCWAEVKTQGSTCTLCGMTRAGQQRSADALVLATAEIWEAPALYSFDLGMASMAVGLKCQVLPPPHPDGPLFSRGMR